MVQIRPSPLTSQAVAAISGEQREMTALVACFERPSRTREGRISASFDTVRVCLSARTQVGSVSQLLRLTPRGPGCGCSGHEQATENGQQYLTDSRRRV
jgi:hypothetical protein